MFCLIQRDMPPDDPLYYSEFAYQLATDPAAALAPRSTYPWHMRIGLTVPLALLYRAFGVSALVSNLPSLFAALVILLVVFLAMPSPRAKLLSLGFAIACPQLARHAATLNVDLPLASVLALCTLWLTYRERPSGTRWIAAAMAMWFAAFLVKETAIWFAPVWAYVVVTDARAAGRSFVFRRYAPAVVVGAALGVGYLVLCDRVWGSPWARLHGIQELTFQHGWTMHDQPLQQWLARLTWAPALLLLQMFRVLLLPVFAGLWLVRGRDALWGVAALTTVGFYWFGTSSATAYEPLPLWPRMVMPALPFLLATAALSTDRALELGARWRLRSAAAGCLAAALLVPAAMASAGQLRLTRPETAAFRALRTELAALPSTSHRVLLVCGDRWFPTLAQFHFGFAPPPALQIVTLDELAALDWTAERAALTEVVAIVHLVRDRDIEPTSRLVALRLRERFAQGPVRLLTIDDLAAVRRAVSAAAPR